MIGVALATLLCSAVGLGSGVTLINNGYDDLVIAINPAVPENPRLVIAIKEMVIQGSAYLHRVTNNKMYFRNVSILIPSSWKTNSSYQRPKSESYSKAEVLIAHRNDAADDSPYTHQYGLCGDPGQYIQFTPNFLLDDKNLDAYGPRGRIFVHEWGHLRWGLYDEYNNDIPFYIDSGNVEFTRCSKNITGGNGVVTCGSTGTCRVRNCNSDLITGLPEKGCSFFPDKEQTSTESVMALQWIDNVQGFCMASSHNKAAPNLQNQLCGLKSAWEVMLGHQDFANLTVDKASDPSFTFLQPIHRVIVLVLDVSGSMRNFKRISRLKQASEIYIMQILEDETMAGIVKFDDKATVNRELIKITDDASRKELVKYLPRDSSGGGTNICEGVRKGLSVLSADNADASGDEIVLLTDGEDNGISLCFEEVFHSGCTIHTIALGPSADPGLETLSKVTGGLNFYATDKLNANGLVDAFTSTTIDNGNPHALVIQLESAGETLRNSSECLQGVVFMDTSVGNRTKFVTTWFSNIAPGILISEPSGGRYNNSDFSISEDFKTARLTIPGTSQAGMWSYLICNRAAEEDTVTLMVTSGASRQGVAPITLNAHVLPAVGGQPDIMGLYAQVMQGFTPVVGATVTAFIERPNEPLVYKLQLLDNGSGADVKKDDGVYSRFFTQFTATGRYSVKVKVTGDSASTRLAPRTNSRAAFISGVRNEKGELEVTQVPAPAGGQVLVPSEDISRVASGGSFQATVPPGWPLDIYPPCRVLDLKAQLQGSGIISLTWTAPGDDADFGQASRYEIMSSESLDAFLEDANASSLVPLESIASGNLSSPAPAGELETFTVSTSGVAAGGALYFSVRGVDKADNRAVISNVASARRAPDPPSRRWHVAAMVIVTFVSALAIVGGVAAVTVVASRRCARAKQSDVKVDLEWYQRSNAMPMY